MTYRVKRMDYGPRFTTIADGFSRRSAGWAWLIDWATTHGYTVIYHEIDAENDAIDAMLAKHDNLYQFAVERQH